MQHNGGVQWGPLNSASKCAEEFDQIKRGAQFRGPFTCPPNQREHFLSEVNNRETIAATEANNGAYCLQKRIEKFPLNLASKYVEEFGPIKRDVQLSRGRIKRDPLYLPLHYRGLLSVSCFLPLMSASTES